MRPLLLLLFVSAPALADETIGAPRTASFTGPPPELALGAAQLGLPELHDVLDDHDDRPSAAATAYGQLVAGSSGVGLGGGAAAAIAGASCDLARGEVQGLVHTDRDAPVAGVARADLCLDLGVFIRYTAERVAGLAPAIDARRSLWRRPYDETYSRVEMGIGPFSHGGNRYSIFHMAFGHGEIDQSDDATSRRIVDIDLDFAMFTFERAHSLRIDAVAITNDSIKAGDSDLGSVTTDLFPVRASIDTGDWFASARAGWAWAGGKTTQSESTTVDGKTTSTYNETVDSSGLPEMTTFAGEATLGGRSGNFTGSATVAHDLYPTFDGNLAAETRASSTATLALGKTTISLSPFVARTRTFARDAGEQRTVSGGAQLQIGRALSHHLHLDALAEAGRTPYTHLTGGRDPDNTLGGRVMVALTARRHGVRPHAKL